MDKIRNILAGTILGFIFGTIYYFVPAKFLITGPMKIDSIMLPEGVNQAIILLSLKWGGIIGGAIGFLGGASKLADRDNREMSISLSCSCFLVCTVVSFIMHCSNLLDMAIWKIILYILFQFFVFLICIPLGKSFNFIESIKE